LLIPVNHIIGRSHYYQQCNDGNGELSTRGKNLYRQSYMLSLASLGFDSPANLCQKYNRREFSSHPPHIKTNTKAFKTDRPEISTFTQNFELF